MTDTEQRLQAMERTVKALSRLVYEFLDRQDDDQPHDILKQRFRELVPGEYWPGPGA